MLGHRHHRRVRQVPAVIDVQAREARAVLGHRHHRRVRQLRAANDVQAREARAVLSDANQYRVFKKLRVLGLE